MLDLGLYNETQLGKKKEKDINVNSVHVLVYVQDNVWGLVI